MFSTSNNFVPLLLPLSDLVSQFPLNEESEMDVYNYLTQDQTRNQMLQQQQQLQFQQQQQQQFTFQHLPLPSLSSTANHLLQKERCPPPNSISPSVFASPSSISATSTTPSSSPKSSYVSNSNQHLTASEKKRKIKEKVYLQKIKIMKLNQGQNGEASQDPSVLNNVLSLGWKEFEASQEALREKDKEKEKEKEKKKRKCTNCRTSCSPIWRFGVDNEILCNACGLYYRQHKQHRPLSIQKKGQKKGVIDPSHFCSLCGSRQTSIWRRGLDGQRLCNACGIKIRYKNKEKQSSSSSTAATSSENQGNTTNSSTSNTNTTSAAQNALFLSNCQFHVSSLKTETMPMKEDKDLYVIQSEVRSVSPLDTHDAEESSPDMALDGDCGLVVFHSLFSTSSSLASEFLYPSTHECKINEEDIEDEDDGSEDDLQVRFGKNLVSKKKGIKSSLNNLKQVVGSSDESSNTSSDAESEHQELHVRHPRAELDTFTTHWH